MKAKIWKSFFIILFLHSLTLNAFGNSNIKKSVSITNLETNYLKKIPNTDYILGPGDAISIIVGRDYPELNIVEFIDSEGTINLPKLKRIYVEGLTKDELTQLLDDAYMEYVKYPSVEIRIAQYRPIKVFVEGEVIKPGIRILDGSISDDGPGSKLSPYKNAFNYETQVKPLKNSYFPTVFDAIQVSGGITKYSDLSNIKVIRKKSISKGGGKMMTTLNFKEVITKGDNTQNIRIYDSDTIVINKLDEPNQIMLGKAISSNLNSKNINVFVLGRVNNPGKVNISRASSLNDAIIYAGGTKALKGKIRFIRFRNDGSMDKRKFAMSSKSQRGSYKNPNLEGGDLIIVGKSFLSSSAEVINEVTSPFTGLISTYGLIKAVSD